MKKIFFILLLSNITLYSYSQQWAGSTTTSGVINRFGTTQIIPTTSGSPYVEIANSSIWLKEWYNQSYMGDYMKLTPSNFFMSKGVPVVTSSSSISSGAFTFKYYLSGGDHLFQFQSGNLSLSKGNFTMGSSSFLDQNRLFLYGRLGVDITTPLSKIHVKAEGNPSFTEGQISGTTMHGFQIYGTDQGMYMGVNTTQRLAYIQSVDLNTAPSTLALNARGGNVTIGTTSPQQGYKLSVNGGIICEEIKVILDVPASDFVFETDYPLMSLEDLELFVKTNKHLPEVPSAAEFAENGYSVGQMDDLLLRKVEELSLYVIELQKQILELQSQINLK